jgi:glycosyltransferase involved in cell wall biosynthesis
MMTKKLAHVAFFFHRITGGGAERVLMYVARGFAEQGLKVDMVLNDIESSHLHHLPPEVRIVDLKTPRSSTDITLLSVSSLVRYLKQEKPQAMISTLHYNVEMMLLAKFISGVPVQTVVTEQNHLSQSTRNSIRRKKRLIPLAAKLSYPWLNKITAASKGVAKNLSHVTGVPLEQIEVIYNPAITPELLDKAKEPVNHPWFQPEEPPVILGVGRLEPQKDFPTLIRAFAQIRQVQTARLVILGEGPDKPQLQSLIEELGLQSDVTLAGYTSNPFAYMAKASVFVLSSAWEGFGIVIAEALAVGTPVVSTNCPSGPAEILDNGKYGFLTPVGDAKSLAEATLKVLSGEAKPVDASWLEQFTLKAVSQKYLDLIGITY